MGLEWKRDAEKICELKSRALQNWCLFGEGSWPFRQYGCHGVRCILRTLESTNIGSDSAVKLQAYTELETNLQRGHVLV